MARKYIKMREMEDEIIKTHKTGLTVRETAKLYGLEHKQVENLITRHNRRLKEMEDGIPPNPKGRPRKRHGTTQDELEVENKRLRMENELLRDFLKETGRGWRQK